VPLRSLFAPIKPGEIVSHIPAEILLSGQKGRFEKNRPFYFFRGFFAYLCAFYSFTGCKKRIFLLE
jgi:hypothetical protein